MWPSSVAVERGGVYEVGLKIVQERLQIGATSSIDGGTVQALLLMLFGICFWKVANRLLWGMVCCVECSRGPIFGGSCHFGS